MKRNIALVAPPIPRANPANFSISSIFSMRPKNAAAPSAEISAMKKMVSENMEASTHQMHHFFKRNACTDSK